MANYKRNRSWKKSSYGKKVRRSSRSTVGRNKKRSSSNSLTDLAYKMGLVERGLKNPDSKISDSYNRGLVKPEKRPKKTLF